MNNVYFLKLNHIIRWILCLIICVNLLVSLCVCMRLDSRGEDTQTHDSRHRQSAQCGLGSSLGSSLLLSTWSESSLRRGRNVERSDSIDSWPKPQSLHNAFLFHSFYLRDIHPPHLRGPLDWRKGKQTALEDLFTCLLCLKKKMWWYQHAACRSSKKKKKKN